MKKLFMVMVAMVLMATTGSALATEARIAALGENVAPYICDDANILTWYATLPSYSNLMVVYLDNEDWEWGDDEGEYIRAIYGLTYALGEDGSWGTLGIGLMENMYAPNYGFRMSRDIWGSWNDDDLARDSLYNKYFLMYGYQMEEMSFGLFFSRSSIAEKDDEDYGTPYEQEEKEAYTTIGVGFNMEIGEDMVLNTAFDYTMASYLYTYTDIDEDEEYDPGKVMAFRARMFYDWRENLTFVPYFDFSMSEFAYSPEPDYATEYGFKSTAFKFGIGANMNVNEDNMIVFAVEPFAYWKGQPSGYTEGYEEEWEVTCKTMPKFILALESELTDWLTFRTGCSKALSKWGYSWSDEDDSDEWWTTDPDDMSDDYWDKFAWHLGLGFHFGDFDIDCLLNRDVPFTMGYWLTGYDAHPQDVTPIGMVSAVYHF